MRWVELVPALPEELTVHRANAGSPAPDQLVFPSASGEPHSPSNVRSRTMARSLNAAHELLAERDETPIGAGLTPRSLRRTFASLLYALGHDTVCVMQQMGHTDPKLALRIYAQAMRRGDDEKAALRALVEGADSAQMGTNRSQSRKDDRPSRTTATRKPRGSGASSDGRGWFRTTDLSRVKRALSH